MSSDNRAVWVFNGEGGQFPGAVFSTRRDAEEWIAKHRVTGILTLYPLDIGVYEWAIDNGYFKPKHDLDARAIGKFTSAHQEHVHFEGGRQVA